MEASKFGSCSSLEIIDHGDIENELLDAAKEEKFNASTASFEVPAPTNDVLTTSQYSQVVFHDVLDVYSIDTDIIVRFEYQGKDVSEKAKVAIFRTPYLETPDFLTYSWVRKIENGKGEVTFSKESLPQQPDFYQFQYIQEDDRIAGASIPWQIKESASASCMMTSTPDKPDTPSTTAPNSNTSPHKVMPAESHNNVQEDTQMSLLNDASILTVSKDDSIELTLQSQQQPQSGENVNQSELFKQLDGPSSKLTHLCIAEQVKVLDPSEMRDFLTMMMQRVNSRNYDNIAGVIGLLHNMNIAAAVGGVETQQEIITVQQFLSLNFPHSSTLNATRPTTLAHVPIEPVSTLDGHEATSNIETTTTHTGAAEARGDESIVMVLSSLGSKLDLAEKIAEEKGEQCGQLETRINQLEANETRLEQENQTLKTSLDKQHTEVDVLQKQNATLTKEVENLQESLQARYLSVETKEEEIRCLRQKLSTVELGVQTLARTESIVDSTNERINKVESAAVSTQHLLDKMTNEHMKTERDRLKLEAEVRQLQSKLAEYMQEKAQQVDKLLDEINKRTAVLDSKEQLVQEVNRLKARIATLESELQETSLMLDAAQKSKEAAALEIGSLEVQIAHKNQQLEHAVQPHLLKDRACSTNEIEQLSQAVTVSGNQVDPDITKVLSDLGAMLEAANTKIMKMEPELETAREKSRQAENLSRAFADENSRLQAALKRADEELKRANERERELVECRSKPVSTQPQTDPMSLASTLTDCSIPETGGTACSSESNSNFNSLRIEEQLLSANEQLNGMEVKARIAENEQVKAESDGIPEIRPKSPARYSSGSESDFAKVFTNTSSNKPVKPLKTPSASSFVGALCVFCLEPYSDAGHNCTASEEVACQHCPEKFKGRQALDLMLSHNEKYHAPLQCPICFREFSKKESDALETHVNEHFIQEEAALWDLGID